MPNDADSAGRKRPGISPWRVLAVVLLLVAMAVSAAWPALAAKADVIGVKLTREPAGTWTIEVTVRSDDTGWQKYADKWEVRTPDGRVLGVRTLFHPHEDEQPFTRDLGGVAIPDGVAEIKVRAHDKAEGWGGTEMTVKVPR